MDLISLAVGFLVGTATGAAASYFADKFTDERREKKTIKDADRTWRDIEKRFPALIAEMRQDFSEPANRHVRAFFVKSSNSVLGGSSEPHFEYHTDKHPDIRAVIATLEEHGLIANITRGNCPMYRISEKLADQLIA